MTRSRIIDRQFSNHQTADKKRRVRRSHPTEICLTLERLEVRNLLSIAGGSSESLWLAMFAGMPGDTRASQIQDAQQLLAGVQNVQVMDSVGVPGVVVLQTSPDTNLPSLESELMQVPGFRYVEAYDPSADPAGLVSQFPIGPRFDDSGSASDSSTLAPAVSTSSASTSTSTTPPVTEINGFDGMNSQTNPFAISPPDTTGAAGPGSYIETVNVALQIYHKDGTISVPSTQFSDFFSSLGDTRNFSDPVIVYNDITQRFFVGILDYDLNAGISRLDVAISKSPNPVSLTANDWNFYRYNANDLASGFDAADYPKLGYNGEGYVVSFNEFFGGFYYEHAAVLAIRNDGSTATGGEAVAVPGGFSNFTLAPARMHDLPSSSAQPMWFVETPGSSYNSGGDQITVVRMDNPFASPSWTFTNLNVDPYMYQPAPLYGSTGVGTRMYFSALRTTDGVTHLVAANSPGELDGSGNVQSKVHWYDINVTNASSPTLYQEGQINPGPGIDTYFPDADIAPGGYIGMTYSQSLPFYSSDPRAGVMDMYVTGRLPTDPLGTMQPGVVAKLGTAQLDAFGRAGDYSFTTIDPSNGSFWSANEYSASIDTPNWATWIENYRVGDLVVTSSTPANGSTVSTSPSSYVINFSNPIDPTSLNASDLTVDGQPATGVTLSTDQETATFTFATNPAPNQGPHTLAIAAGLITAEGDPNVSNAAYTASFRYDAIIIAPSSTSPAPNGVFTLPGPLTYDITFNEPVDPSSVQASDLILSGVPGATVTSATALPGDTTVQFIVSGITSEGTLNISYLAGTFTDQYGNPGPGFSANYIVDFGTVPFPTPLTPVGQIGSLIYQGSQSGIVQYNGDTDNFTLPVAAGETITALLTTDPSLQGTLSVSAGSATVAGATAAAAGQDVVIQTIKVPGQLGGTSPATTYTFTVGAAGAMLGNYTLKVVLNAAVESESVGGASDDTIATAQDLTNSFVLLHSAGTSDQQPTRAAVLGSLSGASVEATVPQSLENVDSNWGNSFPFILQPWGDSSMRYQQIYSASAMQGGGTIDQIRFRRAEFSPPFPDFQTDVTVLIGYAAVTYDNASQYFDDNLGAGVVTVYNGPLTIPGGGSGYPTNPFNIVINLASDFIYDPSKGDLIVEFDVHSSSATVRSFFSSTSPYQFEPTDPTTRIWWPSDTATSGYVTPGYGLVTQFGYVPDSVDTYQVNLDAGQTATVTATSLSGAPVQVTLLDSSGDKLALGIPSTSGGVASAISDFLATTSGTYYLQITSTGIAQYSLVVTRSAEFDAQNNQSIATAQDLISSEIAGNRWVLGAIQPSQSDFYKITALDSTPIQADAEPPSGPSGQFVDNLVPMLLLYDAAGNLVASSDNAATNGGAAELDYNVPTGQGGVYYIEVTASTATAQPTNGEYALSVMGATGALPSFSVTSSIPANGALLALPPSQITAGFNLGVSLPTLAASDLTVDGASSSAVTATEGNTAVFSTRPAYQWSTAVGGNGHYFILTSSPETWTAAEAEAEALGGHLASVDSQSEENFLIQRLMTRGNAQTVYWNGLNDQAANGTFVWASGDPLTYTDWHPGEPNDAPGSGNQYVAMNWAYGLGGADLSSRGDWTDTTNNDNGNPHYGIIELDSLPSGYWPASDGSHSVNIAAGSIADVSGTGIDAYNGNFTLDLTPPRVVSSSIAENQVVSYSGSLTSNLSYTVGFSEPMNTAIATASSFALHGDDRNANYIPASFSWNADGTVVTINYASLPDDAYTLTLFSSSLQDLVGWQLDGERPVGTISTSNPSGNGVEGGDFTLDFVTHFTTASYPGPLTPAQPLGSLVYDPSVNATIAAAGLTDSLTFSLYAGQTVTVSVQPQTSGFQPTVSVIGTDGTTLGSATAAAPGDDAVVETVMASTDGLYTLTVGGSSGTTGLFTAVLTLNSAVQLPGNHSAVTAQDIGASWLPLPDGATRGAVAGNLSGSSGDYYAFHLDAGDTASLGLKLASASSAQIFGNPSVHYTGTLALYAIAEGDLNGDGKQDLVAVSDYYLSSVSIWLGKGDGTFTYGGSYAVGGHYGQAIALADLRGNGKLDIIVTTYDNQSFTSGGISVLLNNGDGTFSSPTDYSTDGYGPAGLAVGDVNGDGHPDVVVVNPGRNTVSVFPGTGTGTLGAPSSYFAGNFPRNLALADLRGTGKPDIVVRDSPNIAVLLNNGSGAFTLGSTYSTGGFGAAGIAVADLGNGHPDIVTVNQYSWSVSVLLGNGDGTFGASTVYPTGQQAASVVLADVNGDSHPDIVTGNASTVSVLLNNGNGIFGSHTDYYDGNGGHYGFQDLVVGDFNGDGLPDLATAGYNDGSLSVLLNTTSRITLQLLGPDGSTVLVAGAGGAGNVDSVIHNYQVSASGIYYAFISGVGGSRAYQLVVTRNADFDTKNNATAAQAQNISGTAGVLGYLDASQGPAAEWFAVQLNAGQSYSFPTSTPNVGGPGLYTNCLIPHIDLYDASGSTLLVSGTKLADGRNETIDFMPTTSGMYLIRLTSQDGTSGEFFLDPAYTVLVPAAHLGDAQERPRSILPSGLPAVVTAPSSGPNPNLAYQAIDLIFQDQQWMADLLEQTRGVSAAPLFGLASSAKGGFDR